MTARWPPRIPFPLFTGSGPPPTPVADKFVPRIIVGNVPNGDTNVAQAAPFQYIPDPGDGSGIAAALAAASVGWTIEIRPGTYDLATGAVATPMTIPLGVHVQGGMAGAGGITSGTVIAAKGGTNVQDVFTLGAGASLEDVLITVPAGTNGTANGAAIVNATGALCRVSRVGVAFTTGAQHNSAVGIGALATGAWSGILIEDCTVVLPTVASTIGPPYIGIVFGAGTDSGDDGDGPIVRGCRTRNGQVGVGFFGTEGGTITDNEILELIASVGGSNGILWQAYNTARTFLRGPRITNNRVLVSTTGDGSTASAACILISTTITSSTCPIQGTVIAHNQLEYRTTANLVSARQAIKIRVEVAATGQNNRGSIVGNTIINAGTAILFQTATTNQTAGAVDGRIEDWAVTGNTAPQSVAYGVTAIEGCSLDIATAGVPKIFRVAITGNGFANMPATGFGVNIGSNVTNTIVSSNELTPNGGTAVQDNGLASQIIGNIT